jgi:hypothetical protein
MKDESQVGTNENRISELIGDMGNNQVKTGNTESKRVEGKHRSTRGRFILALLIGLSLLFLPIAWIKHAPFLTLDPPSASADTDSCWDPVKGHCYPRRMIYHFGEAPAEWYAKFDISISGVEYEKTKEINPTTLTFARRDWNGWEIDENAPQEWYVRDTEGQIVDMSYGQLLDISDYSGRSPAYDNLKYNEYIIEDTIQRTSDPIYDGFFCQGVWDHPYGTENVDLDGNGINDWDEHGRDWLEEVWLAGVHKAVEGVAQNFAQNGKYLILNSGRFHDFEWENSNGLMLEHNGCMYSFRWFTGQYKDWMSVAPEPHLLLNDGWGESKDEFTRMRFLLGITLYGDGYFSFSESGSGEHNYLGYYDEYDINLGWPTSEMQLVKSRSGAENNQGVYVRFFDYGAVIVNVDEVAQTVTDADIQSVSGYEGPYYRFQGGQDPQVNNGTLFDQVDLSGSADGDGYIGDAILLTKTPTTMVTDLYIDDTHQNTSPGSQPAQLTGDWIQDDCECVDSAWTQGCKSWREQWDLAYTQPGDKHATYTPTIHVPGQYEVFEWHGNIIDADEASNVQYTLLHAGGSQSFTVNQQENQGQWNSLGVFDFEGGTTGNITISAQGANGVVIADGFMFVYQGNYGNIKGSVDSNRGDLNLDGHIDSLDLQLCINVFLGMEHDPAISQRADLNGDGSVNLMDIELLAYEIL